MAVESQVPSSILPPWNEGIHRQYLNSPSAASTKSASSTTSSSAFSIDAPSSQSSVTSGSAGWYQSNWLNDSAISSQQQHSCHASYPRETLSLGGFQTPAVTPPKALAPADRQNPRRTQRLCHHESANGSQPPRPPPSLVRQSDRKINFVDSLVDTTTLMVETIWPLSAYVQSRHSSQSSRQPSKMELRYFIQEVLRRSKASYSTLQVALYYLVLVQPFVPKQHDFTTEQPEDSALSFSLQCGRRMFIAALILASKYLQDRNFSASGWSKISGLSTWDLNVNEMAFLKAIDWKLHVPEHIFNRWTDIVLKYSPSAHLKASRSSSMPRLSWQEVILRLTPDLDALDLDGDLSDDSGYCSHESDMSPPPVPARDVMIPGSNQSTPGSSPTRSIPQWLAQASPPSGSPPRTTEQRPLVTPMQPQLSTLPTPEFTPQSNAFCTPAVSVLGFPCGSSMTAAMCQVQQGADTRCTLDRTSEWKSRAARGFFPCQRRSSLATSASLVSSPDSTSDAASQCSMLSSVRPSRSSSISSVASSTCAPPQPTSLAVQATRRCANMQLKNGAKEAGKHFESWQHASARKSADENAASPTNDSTPRIGSESASSVPRNRSTALDSSQQEAASALQDLALNTQQRPQLHRTGTGCKRARPMSVDYSTEEHSNAPRCLADLVNGANPNLTSEGDIIIPDDTVANSFLLRKENKHAVREAHHRRGALRHPSRSFPSTFSTASRKENSSTHGTWGDDKPRKRACAGSMRGGRDEAREEWAEIMRAQVESESAEESDASSTLTVSPEMLA